MDTEKINLTSLSHASGCGCKIAPAILEKILINLPDSTDSSLLVGPETRDDAAVYRINQEQCLISTVDFFTPLVNDAFTFGKIAAANALSDIYAMGGTPIMALSVLGWPVDLLPENMASDVIQGAVEICKEAGIPLAGGHSIHSKEPFFGLSAQGICLEKNIKTNANAKAGDLIFLTKPLGSGLFGAAHKRQGFPWDSSAEIIYELTKLNTIGIRLSAFEDVHALTDVTGFGLNGHLKEMCEGSKLSCIINKSKIPRFSEAESWIQQGLIPDNTYRNSNGLNNIVTGLDDMIHFALTNDPQTNGGLLIAVKPESEHQIIQLMEEYNINPHCLQAIGHFEEAPNGQYGIQYIS